MQTKQALQRELDRTDRRMMALIEDLTDEQLRVPYERGINPPLWEAGHAAFFYEYFLLRELGGADPRMPGYDEIWDSFEIQHRMRWDTTVVPDKQTTLDYYHGILDETRRRLDRTDPDPREHYLCQYCIAHQNMHLESLIWARQTLGYPPPSSAAFGSQGGAAPPAEGDAAITGGSCLIGMPANSRERAGSDFSFDNERPGFRMHIDPFAISKMLVTNRDFLAFVDDGGYADESAWSLGGNWWRKQEKAAHPIYWRGDNDGRWQLRRFDRWIDLPLDAPVLHVSFWEAEAFCAWSGRRLPTEFEWEVAARGSEGRMFPWGETMDDRVVDMNGELLGSAPAHAFPEGATPEGCLQMIGTAWEWTTSQFLPYDGFTMDMYPYMSTLQFGDHKTARGGSGATSSSLIRSSYRQAYFPGRRDVFTGFRTCAG